MDQKWVEGLKRLAAANARANRERLLRWTRDESLREFERHCTEMHAAFEEPPMPKRHSVGLVKFWKKS